MSDFSGKIGLLGLGEVGRILAEDLLQLHPLLQLRCWDRQFDCDDSKPSQNRMQLEQSGRLECAHNATVLAQGCDLVISAVTAGEAVSAALSVLPGLAAGAWFVDVNSVSPGSKITMAARVTEAGGRFVEVAVMSPIMPARIQSPMLVAGPGAREFLPLGQRLGFGHMSVLSDSQGQAAATKMCRSVVIKGMEALLTESLLAARHYGVESEVLDSLTNLFPGIHWEEKSQYMISRSIQHGKRRAEEMLEACETVAGAGLSPWMSRGSVDRQDWAAQFTQALAEGSLNGMLDGVLQSKSITRWK